MKDRKHNRMTGFDYSSERLYFVTSCTHNKVHYFGNIVNGIMIKNQCGDIAEKQWCWLGQQYSYVVLHSYVVMPNHIHGIIEINAMNVGTGRDLSLNEQTGRMLGTGHDLSLPLIKIKSLSELMGAYKTTISKQIHLLNFEFSWQRSFHDHIIRNENQFQNITNYIQSNPGKWKEDCFFGNQITEEGK